MHIGTVATVDKEKTLRGQVAQGRAKLLIIRLAIIEGELYIAGYSLYYHALRPHESKRMQLYTDNPHK